MLELLQESGILSQMIEIYGAMACRNACDIEIKVHTYQATPVGKQGKDCSVRNTKPDIFGYFDDRYTRNGQFIGLQDQFS